MSLFHVRMSEDVNDFLLVLLIVNCACLNVHLASLIDAPGGGTPLFGLYGDVPLDRVWFFGLAVLNRVYNLTCLCPKQVKTCLKQGMVLRAERL